MEQKNEALYLINGDRFLHLRENGAGVGFATYDCATGEPQEFGQISKQNLPPDGQNAIPAARNWYLFELSSDDRKAIQEVSLQHLDTIPQSGVRRRRIWDDPTIPRDDVRLINSHYDDLYRVPNHSVIQIDRSDGSSYTARVEHLDDYHFDLGEYGNVYHICQFGEIMERNGSTAYPEIQTQNEQGAWELSGKGYLAIQSCEDGWDYTIYHSDFSVMDGGQLDEPELTIQEVREEILEAHHMTYDEKKTAGERLILACMELPNTEEQVVGSYRGFELSLRFDTFHNEHQALLKGTLKYPVPLGSDPHGNIVRLDNALSNFADRSTAAENELDTLRQQQAAAQVEVAKPFPQEEELAQKSARLAELNAQLDVDEKHHEPEQDEEEKEDAPRRSVLAVLEEKAEKAEPVKPFKSYLDKDGDAR